MNGSSWDKGALIGDTNLSNKGLILLINILDIVL